MTPGAPRTTLGLLAPCTTRSAHVSSSSPLRISTSARRSLSMRLGRISTSWTFCVPRASESTSTRSPPTSSASDFRSGMVATTRSLAASAAPAKRPATTSAATMVRMQALVMAGLLEGVRRVGAEDECGLEEQLVENAAAAGLRAHTVRALGVLVAEPEAQELRRHEGHVRLHGPLPARLHGILRRVVARAEGPAAPRLHLRVRVP